NRNLTLFWNEFGYQSNKDMEKPLDSIQYQRRQAMAIPLIIQCDLCLKWRVLPSSTYYQEKECLDVWICTNNPNLSENSCHQIERLPSIPLGTMNTVSPSKNEKEKQLTESIQRYQNRLAEQQPQSQFIPMDRITELTSTCPIATRKENTKTQKTRLLRDDLKHESLSSFKLSISHRGQKRYTEGADSDVEYVSETKIMKKSVKKNAKPQQQSYPAALPVNVRLAERSQKSQIAASSWKMKRKQSHNFVQEYKVLTEVENGNSDPDIVLVSDKSDTDVSLKQERKEILLIDKEKQEPCSDAPVMETSSSLPNWKSLPSVPLEDVNLNCGHKGKVSVSGNCQVDSSLTTSSSTISVKEIVRKLTSNLREILLYFFRECQLPLEFDCTSVEELISSSELEQCPEQTNKKLKMCFNQIQNIYMVQYEKKLKRKIQSVIYDANRRGVLNEICLGQCEKKRKMTEDKLKNLRVKLEAVLQKLQLGGPAGDLEQIDTYLEALLKEDNLLFQKTLNKVTIDTEPSLPLGKN
ncbi:MORC family CW-type zinc finger protein 1, partial [Carlito syrichta]|uniref:MORC family CW-type zinc finger protein 1 n=1 Tax=Carlito syrichta TaxID=1868482 RepID=A0A1U7TUA0_CARSF